MIDAQQTVVRLGASCSIREAAELKSDLLTLLDTPATVTIDGSAVTRIDTAGIQLLYAFARERLKRGYDVAWVGCEAAVDEAARTLGVTLALASGTV